MIRFANTDRKESCVLADILLSTRPNAELNLLVVIVFYHTALNIWNSLPSELTDDFMSLSLNVFKRKLKTCFTLCRTLLNHVIFAAPAIRYFTNWQMACYQLFNTIQTVDSSLHPIRPVLRTLVQYLIAFRSQLAAASMSYPAGFWGFFSTTSG